MLKKKLTLFLSFLIIFSLSGFALALALEVKYPSVPGLPDINQNTPGISELVGYWFGLLVYIAGIISLISFTVGAIGLINPDVEAHKDAKDRMKGAILGLVLTLASFIIIRTINTSLITPSLTPLPGVAGVFYWDGTTEKPVGIQETDVANRPAELKTFNSIKYDCTKGGTGPALLIWEFPKAQLEAGNGNLNAVKVVRINCGGIESIGGLGSFKMTWETSGVYYCFSGCGGSDNMCSGYMSNAATNSQDNIGAPFNGNIRGVRIVNDSAGGLYYGVIFHKNIGLVNGGDCNPPIINSGNGASCDSVNDPDSTFAVDIFKLNTTPQTSGNGVSFFSKSFGDLTGQNAGFINVPSGSISGLYSQDPSKMCFNYTNVTGVPDSEKYKCEGSAACGGNNYDCKSDSNCYPGEMCDPDTNTCVGENGQALCSKDACETFQDCQGAIIIKGSYLVGIYSKDTSDYKKPDTLYCLTSTQQIDAAGDRAYLAPGGTKADLTQIYIIPTK